MKWLHIFLIFIGLLLFISTGFAQSQAPKTTSTPTFKLFLIGDAGEGDTTGATLYDLSVQLRNNPNSAVVFLGDNCYVKSLWGLMKFEIGGFDGGKVARRRVMAQLN